MNDEPQLSETTRAEQEAGKKAAAANATAFEAAEKARIAEKAPPSEDPEAAKAAAEAKPLEVPAKEPVFPLAAEPPNTMRTDGRKAR